LVLRRRDGGSSHSVTAGGELAFSTSPDAEPMQICRVSFEAHHCGATIYITGLLGDHAALRTEELVRALTTEIRSLRVDLRAVDLIDPDSFVLIARTLGRWRDARRGRVSLEFPARSRDRQRAHLRLVDQRRRMGIPVSSAVILPINTSPGH
jgi:hypothetical protein